VSHQRVKLSKKLFMTLKPGQYIMDNFVPMTYEVIGNDLEEQWENWRGGNGNIVNIFESKEDCLRVWWSSNSGLNPGPQSKANYEGKLSKKVFMAQPNGYWLLFTQGSLDYLELDGDREKQWAEYRHVNGRKVRIYKNQGHCILERSAILDLCNK
jgi:hypothetical protein